MIEKDSSAKDSAFESENSNIDSYNEKHEKYEALFDDSNNEIMLECSQAIEEVFQVKDQVIPNLSDPSEEGSVENSQSGDTSSVKNIFHEVLDNRVNKSISDSSEVSNDLRDSVVSNKLDGKCCQGRTRTPQSKAECKRLRQSSRNIEGLSLIHI